MARVGQHEVCGTPIESAGDDDREEAWIVSDLHIPASGGPVLDRFLGLVASVARRGAKCRLLILGDLFDSWVGSKQLVQPVAGCVVSALLAARDAGVSTTVLHGNRDFLLDASFAAASGARVVAGGLQVTLGRRKTLLLHGDELCQRDLPYQRAKRILRHPWTKALVRALPLHCAARLSGAARKRSGMVMHSGDQTRFDPTAAALQEAFSSGVELLIFGHIHRPARGSFAPDREYCILPAFDQDGVFLRHEARGLRYVAQGVVAQGVGAQGVGGEVEVPDFPSRTFP